MANFSDWTPEILPDVPGCPDPLIEDSVRDVVIDFCQRTRWLTKVNATAADVTGGAGERVFATPLLTTGNRVVEAKAAWYLDKPLKLWTPEEAEENLGSTWATQTGEPRAIVMDRLDTYYVAPSPTVTAAAALKMRLVTAPLPTATTCDDLIRNRWREAIKHGAIARLCSMQNKKWTNPDRAGVSAGIYGGAVASAQLAAARGMTKRTLQVRPVFF